MGSGNFIKLQRDNQGRLSTRNLRFGSYTNSSASYLIPLQNPSLTSPIINKALVAPNFMGIGLPYDTRAQILIYLQRLDENWAQNFICLESPEKNYCVFKGSTCDAIYSDVKQIYFQVEFEGNVEYILAPIALFMQTQSGNCQFYLQQVNATSENPSTVVLGSMFMQAFAAGFNSNSGQPPELVLISSDSAPLPALI